MGGAWTVEKVKREGGQVRVVLMLCLPDNYGRVTEVVIPDQMLSEIADYLTPYLHIGGVDKS